MLKMSLIKLSVNEKKILRELDRNSRQSNSQIAKRLKLSRNIINYQIRRMEEAGLIKNYVALLDYSALGYLIFGVYVNLYELDPGAEKKLTDFLLKEKKIGLVAKTVGDWDIHFTVYVKKIMDFQDFWKGLLEQFRSLIKEYTTHLITEERLFPYCYLPTDKRQLNQYWKWDARPNPNLKIDEKDQDLVRLLADHARLPVTVLAEKTKLGSMAVIYRLRQLLKKKVILGYISDRDFNLLGLNFYKVCLELQEVKIIPQLFSYCQAHPNIIQVRRSIGDNVDFEFDLEVHDFEAFLKIVEELKNRLPGAIRDYKYIRFFEILKLVHLPG